MQEKKEMIQNRMLEGLSTKDGRMMMRIYFRGALYRRDSTVTLEGMCNVLGVTTISSEGKVLYRKGQKMKFSSVEKWMQEGFDGYRSGFLFCTEEEQKLLEKSGTSEGAFIRNCRSK